MLWEKKLLRWIDSIRSHTALPLRLCLWNGRQLDFSPQAPQVTIKISHPYDLRFLINPTLHKLGQAYVEGKLEVEGKINAIISVANSLSAISGKAGNMMSSLHMFFPHTKKEDAAAIRYHYDVSNAFYQNFLDENMVYSCAYFEKGDEDLATAQIKKIDHILNKISIKPGDKLLDIGCGWGALVLRAASAYGADCTGITLSENQYLFANERVRKAGLEDRISIRLQDYRDIKGQFDRITSVGMFEHVGLKNLQIYFKTIKNLLTENGLVMNHGITTTRTDHGNAPLGGGDFIENYVFPQGELPHIGYLLTMMQEGGLEVLDVENLRRHYAQTCTVWAENFENNTEKIKLLVDDRHYRIWRVYLAGCAHAFTQDWISINQIVCGKSGRNANNLHRSRQHMYKNSPENDSHLTEHI